LEKKSMATTTRGRGYNTRSTFGSPWGYSFGGAGTSSTRSTGGSNSRTRKAYGKSSGASGYRSLSTTCEQKINSFRCLWNQCKGTAGANRPSPSTLNTFCNWINKGCVVQTCSPSQVQRWARSTNKNFNPKSPSTTACKTVLCAKFGKSAIKAVTKAKNGWYIVATSPTINGRTFNFPH
jgi:hypothetical protein